MVSIFRASLAIWGISLGVGLIPSLLRAAPPSDLPGALKRIGISSSVPATQFAVIIVLPFLVTLLFGRFARLAAERRWAAWSSSIALASAPVTLMAFGNVRHVLLHGVAAAAIIAARRLGPRFTRADVVLIPSLLVLYFAFLDLGFGRTNAPTFLRAAFVLFAFRVAVGAFSRSARPGLAFAAAPLGFLAQMHHFQPAASGILAVVFVLATPLVLLRVADRKLRRFATYIAYPIAVAAYPLAVLGWTTPIHVDLFEDSHSLLPASEMARGELPYRDFTPIHGVISDGVLDFAAMKIAGDDLGSILKTRRWVGALAVAAIYFVALGATTSGDLALLAVFLSLAFFPSNSVWLRAIAALLVLACTAAAIRLRSRRWFVVAGALLVAALLLSVDLAIFSGIVAVIAALRARSIRQLAIGFGAAALPVLAIFTVSGLLVPFVRSTVSEVLGTSGVYIVGPLEMPEGLYTTGKIVAWIGETTTIAGLAWFIALIAAAAALTDSPFRSRRGDAAWIVGLWIVVAGASYVVRRHYYFAFAVAPFLIAAILAIRRRARFAAIAVAIVVGIVAKPFSHVYDIATPLRRSGGIVAGSSSEYDGVKRARGAVFDPLTKAALGSAQQFVTTSLRPGETFYDFASVGLLYYLFDRDCPVRPITVPAAESDAAQREVIAALQRNPRVRAALIHFPGNLDPIDDVSFADRAPLIWRYLQQNFRPAFDENGVVFWMRVR